MSKIEKKNAVISYDCMGKHYEFPVKITETHYEMSGLPNCPKYCKKIIFECVATSFFQSCPPKKL